MTTDALLLALAEARRRKEEADQMIRLLVAWGREFAAPRPYRLADLAEAAGMSVSGVRTAYGPRDVERAAQLLPSPAPDIKQLQDYCHALTARRSPANPA